MLKKLLSMALCAIMIMGMGTTAFAAESQQENRNGFYILSEEVPYQATEHVQNTIGSLIADLANISTVVVGTPFKLSGTYYDLYYYTIYSNNKIIGTYRVYENENSYTGIFSENQDLINGLQGISDLTSTSKPAQIIAGNHDDIYAIIDSDVYTILEDAAGNSTDAQSILAHPQVLTATDIVDISTGISFDLPVPSARTSPSYKFLQIGWDEIQSSLPWCMAYVTASIMRYKTGNSLSDLSARTVMEWAYPDLTTTELEKTALSTSKADGYANTHSVDPTYTASRRTYAQVTSDINADSPVAFICDNVNTGAKNPTPLFVGDIMIIVELHFIQFGILGIQSLNVYIPVTILMSIRQVQPNIYGLQLCMVGSEDIYYEKTFNIYGYYYLFHNVHNRM